MSEPHFTEENNLTELQPVPEVSAAESASVPSNIPLGVVGALLGAAIGAVAWIALYQLGYIASLCGLLMFFLAMKGYGLLGRKTDKTGIILSAVITLLMIFVAVYLSWTVSIYLELKELNMNPTVQVALEWTKVILADPEAKGDFLKDLLSGYGLGLLGIAPTVVRHFQNAK